MVTDVVVVVADEAEIAYVFPFRVSHRSSVIIPSLTTRQCSCPQFGHSNTWLPFNSMSISNWT